MEQAKRMVAIKKVPSLLMLLGLMLATLLAAAVPAFAQDGISGPSREVVVTGVLRALDVDCDECARYAITDEATGTDYKLISDPRNPYGGVDLSQYVGLKVTAHAIPQFNFDGLYVNQIQSADASSRFPQGTVVATFELAVEGEVPAGTKFFGIIGSPEIATGLLLDQDGDGVYTVSLSVERGAEQEVLIERADPIPDALIAPLAATSTFKDFGLVKFDEDKTFSAKVNFKKDQGGTTTPDPVTGGSDNSGSFGNDNPSSGTASGDTGADGSSSGSASGSAATVGGSGAKTLPATGGALPIALGAGALLLSGGLLVRRFAK